MIFLANNKHLSKSLRGSLLAKYLTPDGAAITNLSTSVGSEIPSQFLLFIFQLNWSWFNDEPMKPVYPINTFILNSLFG